MGVENTPMLAQAADWLLGYMAGRIDSGDRRDPASQLSTSEQFDLVSAIAGYCSKHPNDPLVVAARDYARSVFGTDPVHVVEEAAPDHVPRPELREDQPANPAARIDE